MGGKAPRHCAVSSAACISYPPSACLFLSPSSALMLILCLPALWMCPPLRNLFSRSPSFRSPEHASCPVFTCWLCLLSCACLHPLSSSPLSLFVCLSLACMSPLSTFHSVCCPFFALRSLFFHLHFPEPPFMPCRVSSRPHRTPPPRLHQRCQQDGVHLSARKNPSVRDHLCLCAQPLQRQAAGPAGQGHRSDGHLPPGRRELAPVRRILIHVHLLRLK